MEFIGTHQGNRWVPMVSLWSVDSMCIVLLELGIHIADFTYCPTMSGWEFTTFVVDVFARKIVGWEGCIGDDHRPRRGGPSTTLSTPGSVLANRFEQACSPQ